MILSEPKYLTIRITTGFEEDSELSEAVKFLDNHFEIPEIFDKDLKLTINLKSYKDLDEIVNCLTHYTESPVLVFVNSI